MQGIGYVVIGGEKVPVLFRENWSPRNPYRSFKLRKGKVEDHHVFFEDESTFLSERPDVVERLMSGKVIKL